MTDTKTTTPTLQDAAQIALETLAAHPTQPAALTEEQLLTCLRDARCMGKVRLTVESGPYSIDRPTVAAENLAAAILRMWEALRDAASAEATA